MVAIGQQTVGGESLHETLTDALLQPFYFFTLHFMNTR